MLRGSFDQPAVCLHSPLLLGRCTPNAHAKAPRPHNGFLAVKQATPRPHQWGGPACHSPGVTGFKPFKRLNILLACLIPQPTGTPRPHQWLLMGVQACRLPGLKPLKGLKGLKLKTLKSVASSRGPACRSPGVTRFKPFKRLNILLACLIPQPTGTPRPHQ